MATSTVVVAREDLSIPGALEPNNAGINSPEQVANQFFNILDQHKADAVVLDLMGSQGHGVAAIRRIRRGSAVPIVVLCPAEDKRMAAYRRAGAVTCMSPPIDLIRLRETVLPSAQRDLVEQAETLSFAGLVLYPRDKRLTGPGGREVTLSEVEAGVLLHLAGTPGVIWPAEAILESRLGGRLLPRTGFGFDIHRKGFAHAAVRAWSRVEQFRCVCAPQLHRKSVHCVS